jgi:hypothetical protein
MILTDPIKKLLKKAASRIKGSARRVFMAETVKELGEGGQSRAERELGWNRTTIRKGTHELESGIKCIDNFSGRGRKRSEEHLPDLLGDIKSIVDGQSQTDPDFKHNRLYTRLSAEEVRNQLIEKRNYTEEQLPTSRTIANKLNELGYYPTRVVKSKPLKKIPETDAIFEKMKQVNEEADASEDVLRVSMDTKATVKIGPFSRGGKNRVKVKASDHDFGGTGTLVPFGILLPKYDELSIYFSTSKATSDFMVDRLDAWWQEIQVRFPNVKKLVINQDNGPENSSRRTQFMKRVVEFAEKYQIDILLAYYPPYHSKYNTVERCWGVLEQHWSGDLLDEIRTAIGFAESMTWKGKHPIVKLVTDIYEKGVKLGKQAMKMVEKQLKRLPKLEKWFVEISFYRPAPAPGESHH